MGSTVPRHWKLEIIPLLCIDALMLSAAFILGFWLRLESGLLVYSSAYDVWVYHQVLILSLPLFGVIFYSCRLYEVDEIFFGTSEYVQVIKAMTFAVIAVIVVSFIIHSQPLSRSWLLLFWIFGIFFVCLGRFALRRIIRIFFRSGRLLEPVLIVGGSEEARTITRTLNKSGRFKIVGFLDDFSPVGQKVIGDIKIKGSPQDCERIAREEGVSKLILVPGAVSWDTYQDIFFEATKWRGLEVLVAPRLGGLFNGNLRVCYIGYVPMLIFQPGYSSGMNKFIKYCLDFSLGMIIFLLTLPVLLIIGVSLYSRHGLPIFERHQVLGLHGRTFHAFKFFTGLGTTRRFFQTAAGTGTADLGGENHWLQRILFTTGLDKLPQLINVLRGQMSLVGPRTIYMVDVQSYGIWLQNLVTVKPGMTGPWAFGQRDIQQEIAMAFSYIHTWTPWKDLQIFCLTFFFLMQKRLMVRPEKEN
jgi:lipopolysaccharide/colanic/teichoic acid biosynthesis glycosyltransferase